MRKDFNVMRDIAVHTRVPPAKRVEEMAEFIGHMSEVPEVKKELECWGICLYCMQCPNPL